MNIGSPCDWLFGLGEGLLSLSFLFSFFRKSPCTCTQNSIKSGEYQSERLGGVEREEINRKKGIEPSVIPPFSRLPPVKWPSSSCSPDSFLWPVRSNCSVCVLPARPELWEPGDLDSRLKCRAGERSSLESLTMLRVSHEPKAERLHSPCVVRSNPPPKHPPQVLQGCCPDTGWPLLPTDTLHPPFDICSYICLRPSKTSFKLKLSMYWVFIFSVIPG